MRPFIRATLTASVVAGVLAFSGGAAIADVEHCPDKDNTNKVETSNESFVPPVGAEVCVKGGTTNTGVVIADGVKTVGQYLDAVTTSGVSYYIVYSTPPTTTAPEETTTTTVVEETTTTTVAEETTTTAAAEGAVPTTATAQASGGPTPPAAPSVGAAAPFQAAPVPTQLPSTGNSSWSLAMIALASLLGGLGLTKLARRTS